MRDGIQILARGSTLHYSICHENIIVIVIAAIVWYGICVNYQLVSE